MRFDGRSGALSQSPESYWPVQKTKSGGRGEGGRGRGGGGWWKCRVDHSPPVHAGSPGVVAGGPSRARRARRSGKVASFPARIASVASPSAAAKSGSV